ncbi:MAG: DUF1254 domain-containing protein [Xanthobacteraceae bacterium]
MIRKLVLETPETSPKLDLRRRPRKTAHHAITLVAAFVAALMIAVSGAATPTRAGEAVSEQEAYEIGLDAYAYLYPLVIMELTRAQMTNIEPGKPPLRPPMNAFGHLRAFPPAGFKLVVRPNFDTLYSSAWLDLSKEPLIVSVPDTAARYYLLAMLDMWTDVFAVVGKRTTGTAAGDYALVAPGWRGRLPDGVGRIDAPTPTIWILGRTQTNGPNDYAAVHAVQDGFRVRPLSQWGGEARPATPVFDPSVDMTTPPPRQVGAMSAARFFAVATEVLRRQGPHLVDQPILARMKRIGLQSDAVFDLNAADPTIRRGLERAASGALKLTADKASSIGRQVNGWQINTDTIGVYGTSYLVRAIVARTLLGANLPEDAFYPATSVDGDGKPLDGTNRYLIRFEKDQRPPVSAFWSITLYDAEGYAVANALDRFAIGDRDRLVLNGDGSLDIVVSAAHPGPDKRFNWLPAPAGPFNLTMRLYGPTRGVLEGTWLPPPVRRLP